MNEMIFNFLINLNEFVSTYYIYSFCFFFIISTLYFTFSLPGGIIILLSSGFFFGFIALISVAGLPDKKLRNYILQIGLKQDAIQEETLVEEDNSSIFENRKFRFTTKSTANNEEVFKELQKKILLMYERVTLIL